MKNATAVMYTAAVAGGGGGDGATTTTDDDDDRRRRFICSFTARERARRRRQRLLPAIECSVTLQIAQQPPDGRTSRVFIANKSGNALRTTRLVDTTTSRDAGRGRTQEFCTVDVKNVQIKIKKRKKT